MTGRDAPPPLPLAPRDRVVYAMLVRAAEAGEPCPCNAEIAAVLGSTSVGAASECVSRLERDGWIAVERGNRQRVVTILATGRRTAGVIAAPHWRQRIATIATTAVAPRRTTDAAPRPTSNCAAPADPLARREQLLDRIEADQARLRRAREVWLDAEQQRYRLPRRGRLIEDMPA